MNARLLFPPWFKVIGILMLVPGLIFGYFAIVYSATDNPNDEIAITLLSAGLLFTGFARSKKEDNLISNTRLSALYWAALLDLVLVTAVWLLSFINSFAAIPVIEKIVSFQLDFYNWLIFLAIFICRYYYLRYKAKNGAQTVLLKQIPFNPYNVIGKITTASLLILLIVALCLDLKSNFYIDSFTFLPAALLLLLVSRERNENEQVTAIRLKAMHWAVFIYYAAFILITWTVYGYIYLLVLIFSMVSLPVVFAFIFYFFLAAARRRVA